MVNENEVQLWISRLETEDSSWNNFEKLSVLYIIRDQLERAQHKEETKAMPIMYSAAPAPVAPVIAEPVMTRTVESIKEYGDSDFLRAVSKVSQEKAWRIMDELMDSLKIVNERVYNGVMRKLGSE